ncbi:hypothetical protein AMATHDRAFT_57132 [Amanita thiersii Skay4041]|uniref:Uncharacterized protein n=1 Tax=Amanita thiersii Skay4041 TaxID=703135 RepID=A0A2A9NW30_9AGAR|nr:hypothetical protein AMATHDRAFT_57132 [Amanita thiersii Skay4041]
MLAIHLSSAIVAGLLLSQADCGAAFALKKRTDSVLSFAAHRSPSEKARVDRINLEQLMDQTLRQHPASNPGPKSWSYQVRYKQDRVKREMEEEDSNLPQWGRPQRQETGRYLQLGHQQVSIKRQQKGTRQVLIKEQRKQRGLQQAWFDEPQGQIIRREPQRYMKVQTKEKYWEPNWGPRPDPQQRYSMQAGQLLTSKPQFDETGQPIGDDAAP